MRWQLSRRPMPATTLVAVGAVAICCSSCLELASVYMTVSTNPLFACALACWAETDATGKARQTIALGGQLANASCEFASVPRAELGEPGVPTRPQLVDPRKLPRRGLNSENGHAAFIHAICHIEFSAINLALDAALRFADLPTEYYRDWLLVAIDEARHFDLLNTHLASLGHAYGDFPAHQGLWSVARQTRNDVLARMALIPRVLEARGLDVTPAMIERLEQHGDRSGADILRTILGDEVRHVAVGSRWFSYLAEARGIDAESTFQQLVASELGPRASSALNIEARRLAGFSETEIAWLSQS